MERRILIVEDDMTARLLIKTLLKSLDKDIKVVEVSNGQEALRELDEKIFDLLLLDIVMPVMNGKELLTQIKSKTKFNHMSIIAITTDNTAKTEMYDLGVDDFLEKPIKRDIFLKKVSERLI